MQLSREVCLKIWKEGVAVDVFNFNPYPAIELWLFVQVHGLKSGPNKSSNHVNTGTSNEGNFIDLDEFRKQFRIRMSDLENSSNNFLGF